MIVLAADLTVGFLKKRAKILILVFFTYLALC